MRKYTVDISSYNAFRAATFGKLFDVDSAFGHQCWDAAALLWLQLNPPRNLDSGRVQLTVSGSGTARGTFEVLQARIRNAGTEFEIITDVTKIKRGDVIVFGTGLGVYGHIGFADEDYRVPTILTYSQNQGGTAGQGQASAFSVRAYSSAALIGAFRLKAWHTRQLTTADALEMLKQVAGLPNTAPPNSTTADALEILRKVAGINKQVQYYIVQSGDTFNKIAAIHGVSPEKLRKENPHITDINRIQAGWVLIIPVK